MTHFLPITLETDKHQLTFQVSTDYYGCWDGSCYYPQLSYDSAVALAKAKQLELPTAILAQRIDSLAALRLQLKPGDQPIQDVPEQWNRYGFPHLPHILAAGHKATFVLGQQPAIWNPDTQQVHPIRADLVTSFGGLRLIQDEVVMDGKVRSYKVLLRDNATFKLLTDKRIIL